MVWKHCWTAIGRSCVSRWSGSVVHFNVANPENPFWARVTQQQVWSRWLWWWLWHLLTVTISGHSRCFIHVSECMQLLHHGVDIAWLQIDQRCAVLCVSAISCRASWYHTGLSHGYFRSVLLTIIISERMFMTFHADVVVQRNPFELMDVLGDKVYIGLDMAMFSSMESMVCGRLHHCWPYGYVTWKEAWFIIITRSIWSNCMTVFNYHSMGMTGMVVGAGFGVFAWQQCSVGHNSVTTVRLQCRCVAVFPLY